MAEDISQLPVDERVRLARRELYDLRYWLMDHQADGRDLEAGAEIYRRWGLDNDEGFDAMIAATRASRDESERQLKEIERQIYRNPIATALYLSGRISRWLGRDKK